MSPYSHPPWLLGLTLAHYAFLLGTSLLSICTLGPFPSGSHFYRVSACGQAQQAHPRKGSTASYPVTVGSLTEPALPPLKRSLVHHLPGEQTGPTPHRSSEREHTTRQRATASHWLLPTRGDLPHTRKQALDTTDVRATRHTRVSQPQRHARLHTCSEHHTCTYAGIPNTYTQANTPHT